jgi:ribonucleoside-diphosphate reductase alpha chain
MEVIKRNGEREVVKFDKITARITKQVRQHKLDKKYIDPYVISQQVISNLYDGIHSNEIDTFIAEHCHGLILKHPDYDRLAVGITVSRMHKECPPTFSEAMQVLINNKDRYGKPAPLISDEVYELSQKYSAQISAEINTEADYEYTYFGLRTLVRSYLLKSDDKIIETPQYLLMRVALGIHGDNLAEAFNTYNDMSERYYTHATPTLFNSGTRRQQNSSCFLIHVPDDLESIYDRIKDAALISKLGGGIGIDVSSIRAAKSYIRGTGGEGNGLIPQMKVWEATGRYVDQSGKRKGSIAVYCQPWHSDIITFIEATKQHGDENLRTRDLFTALWIPDLLMLRAQRNEMWSLFCPDECPGLTETYDEHEGGEFTQLYEKYEQEGRARGTIPAQELLKIIAKVQIESGRPYILYKDAANKKSNQKNVGIIRQSNLCTEIMEVTNEKEEAVCNLASIALPTFWNKTKKTFNHELLVEKTRQLVKNLNRVIDVNFYPTEKTKYSNMRHRPLGLGIQGLADLFAMAGHSFDSEEARRLNEDIAESIYYGAMLESMEEAKLNGAYETFKGSPLSEGKFQFDLWGKTPVSGRYDWDSLRKRVMTHGVRNSLLVAPMPTASTAQILGNNECFEPYTENFYSRRVLSGDLFVVNRNMVTDLLELGLWDENMSRRILNNNGSIYDQSLFMDIPDHIRHKYRTVWEISQSSLLEMAAARGPYVCQSQSLNIFMKDPTVPKLTSAMMKSWKLGLKTGSYYVRTPAARKAVAFTASSNSASTVVSEEKGSEATFDLVFDMSNVVDFNSEEDKAVACSIENPEACEYCSG